MTPGAGRRRLSLAALVLLVLAAECVLVARTAAVDRRLEQLSTDGEFARIFPPGERPARILPSLAADGYDWMRLTREMTARGDWRLRWCGFENAPAGRPVYWHSGLAWGLALLARADGAVTGRPPAEALEHAATWLSPLLLMAALPVALAIAWRRFGLLASAALAAWMIGDYRFMEGFLPAYPDHHGEITLAVLALLLGLALSMGDGLSLAQRRRAIVASAIAGGIGLWISALTFTFALAAAAAGLLVARALHATEDDAELLRLWGRTGAATSVVLYVLEQFPDRLGMRLEVNHPLHALAWLAGAEILALLATPAGRGTIGTRLRLAIAGVAALPAAIVLGGERWFAPRDEFLLAVHARIAEFQPLLDQLRADPDLLWAFPGWVLVFAAGLAVVVARDLPGATRARLAFALAAAALLSAMQLLQSRWGLPASAAMAVVLGCAAASIDGLAARGPRRIVATLLVAGVVALGAFVAARETAKARNVARQPAGLVTRDELIPLQHRDVARVVRADAAGRPVTVLSSPNSTVLLDAFGPFSGLGTLYWENGEGLRAAARIWSAPVDEALPLLEARGVTHVAIFSWENFIEESLAVDRAAGSTSDPGASFGTQVGLRGVTPTWLRALPYPTTGLMRGNGLFIRLYAVEPDQAPADALLHLGDARFVDGDPDGARAAWTRGLEIDPAHEALQARLAPPAGD